MNLRQVIFGVSLTAIFPVTIFAQGLTPATLLKQPTDAWPTYNGDYSGRRFSPLTQINAGNVHTLSLAVDARTGRELWHYQYPPNTGSTIGNRGVGMYGNWLYFETPDSNLVSVDARTGRERWKVQIADPKLDYT